MRITEKNMIDAIKNQGNYNSKNTKVLTEEGVSCVYLFGNLIAKITNKKVYINNCGYKTKTTKSRLNSILNEFVGDRSIYQKDYDWYITGEPISGFSCDFPSGWIEFKNKFTLNTFKS